MVGTREPLRPKSLQPAPEVRSPKLYITEPGQPAARANTPNKEAPYKAAAAKVRKLCGFARSGSQRRT